MSSTRVQFRLAEAIPPSQQGFNLKRGPRGSKYDAAIDHALANPGRPVEVEFRRGKAGMSASAIKGVLRKRRVPGATVAVRGNSVFILVSAQTHAAPTQGTPANGVPAGAR